jgi:hypothetical protein
MNHLNSCKPPGLEGKEHIHISGLQSFRINHTVPYQFMGFHHPAICNRYCIMCEVHALTRTQKQMRYTGFMFVVAVTISPYFKDVENLA